MKVFFPKKGFIDCAEAVRITKILSIDLSKAHDKAAKEYFETLDNS